MGPYWFRFGFGNQRRHAEDDGWPRKTFHQKSNANEANDTDGNIDALLAEAADIMNNADAVLRDAGYVEAADLVEV